MLAGRLAKSGIGKDDTSLSHGGLWPGPEDRTALAMQCNQISRAGQGRAGQDGGQGRIVEWMKLEECKWGWVEMDMEMELGEL